MHCPPNINDVASKLVRAVPKREARRPAMRGVHVLLTEYDARIMLKSLLLEPISRARRDLIGPKNSRPLWLGSFSALKDYVKGYRRPICIIQDETAPYDEKGKGLLVCADTERTGAKESETSNSPLSYDTIGFTTQ